MIMTFVFYKVLGEGRLYLIRYILLVYDSCLYDILVCYIYIYYLYHVFFINFLICYLMFIIYFL